MPQYYQFRDSVTQELVNLQQVDDELRAALNLPADDKNYCNVMDIIRFSCGRLDAMLASIAESDTPLTQHELAVIQDFTHGRYTFETYHSRR